MKDLRVTIIQSKLHWKDIDANLKMFTEFVSSIKKNSTDIIVLPEMFTTGFIMTPAGNSERAGGKTMQWMAEQAKKKNCVITGSIILEKAKKYYNTLIWMQPDGKHKSYDKRHLFGLGGEDKVYTAGKKKLIVEWKGWKVCPMICYDLRFPVWCRYNNDYDVLIFVANWPDKRVVAWRSLLKARAIENQSYVIGANRIGKDGDGVLCSGYSAVIDTLGEQISKTKAHQPSVETVKLSASHINLMRRGLPFLKDRDKFSLKD